MTTKERLAEIAAIAGEDIDTSEIPEADEAWFEGAKLVLPQGGESAAGPAGRGGDAAFGSDAG